MNFADHAEDVIICTDLSGLITYCNQAATLLYRTDRTGMEGKSYTRFLSDTQRKRFNSIRDTLLFNQKVGHFEAEMVTLKGQKVMVSIQYSPVKDELGRIVGISSVQRRLNEYQIVSSNASAIVESAPDAIVVVNEHGQIVLANSQTEQFFGYTRDELLGKEIEILIPSRLHKRHIVHRKGYVHKPDLRPMGMGIELKALRKDGTEFPVEISLSPLETEGGVLISAAIRDTTMRRKAEEALHILAKETEVRNKELEQFAYIASHDLQEPLRTVMSFVELLEKQYKDKFDTKAATYFRFIFQASQRMSFLINNLLDYARIGRNSEVREFDCNDLIKEIRQDLSRRIKETNTSLRREKLPVIRGYRTEMRLLFQNLISNAIKFRKTDNSPEIRISVCTDDQFWHFAVNDNGIGMEEADLPKIFVIFKRLHSKSDYEGTGIGLAHCQKIIDMHRGRIWVTSQAGVGSTFNFTIPKNL